LRICIFGAGAIGGVIAGKLAKSGADVSVVARGENLRAIRANGLTVHTGGTSFTVPVKASDDPADLGRQDAVLLSVKEHQLPAAMSGLPPLLGPETVIVPPTTGIPYWFFDTPGGSKVSPLDPSGQLAAVAPLDRVLGCVYWIGAHAEAPGVVVEDGAGGCPMGEPGGQMSARLRALSDAFMAAGINAPMRDNIRGEIWVKTINSLCWNAVACLTMASNGEIGQSPALDIVRGMMGEADAMAEQLGIAIPYPIEKRLKLTLGAPGHKMSMLRDLEAGKPLEIGALERSIRAVAEMANAQMPTIDTVLSLLQLRAREKLAAIH
jgi:2-dehydropantoate 2-reductase